MVYVTSENSYLKTRVELVSTVGFKPTTIYIDQIRILGRSFSYALRGQFAPPDRIKLPTSVLETDILSLN